MEAIGKPTTGEDSFDTTTADRPLHCMAILDEVPGHQLGEVRRPVGGFTGWLKRLEDRALLRVRPEINSASYVRGSRVAIDYVTSALLQQSKSARFTFAVPDQEVGNFDFWADAQGIAQDTNIVSLTTLAEAGFRDFSPDIWLNLRGNQQFSFSLRERLSRRPFPIVTLQHGLSRHDLLYERFFRSLLSPSYPFDSLICTSRACKAAVSNILESLASGFEIDYGVHLKFEGRLDLIPLCVDTEQLKPAPNTLPRRALGIPADATVLLYLGYISPVKADLAPMLLIFKRLVANNPSKKLLFYIAGTGPDQYATELLRTAKDLELEGRVVILRAVSDEIKLSLFRASDVFVAPCDSMQESFGLTPVEAMACGVPQVASDWSGYRDTIEHGKTGFLIPTMWGLTDSDLRFSGDLLGWVYDHSHQGQSMITDVNAFYNGLQILITNESLRSEMSIASRQRAVSEFSPQTLAKRYEELWGELNRMSRSGSPLPPRSGFFHTSYHKHFGHFASSELNDNFRVLSSSSAEISVNRLLSLSASPETGVAMLDGSLLEAILTVCNPTAIHAEITIRDLLVSLAGNEVTESFLRRHILFLIKYGLLTIQSG